MQQELRDDFPSVNVSILGINDAVSEPGNEPTTDGRDIPWLQDVDENSDLQSDVWTAWDVVERDVIILDDENRPVGRYNLTANDLGDPALYAELRELILDIASFQSAPSSLSGYVYFDVSNDGIKDSAESAIGNVLVTLDGTTTQGQAIQQTQMTEANGSYEFFGLDAGTYTISQSQPTSVLDGVDTVGSAGGTAENDRFTVVLGEGVDGEDYNFGERGRQAASIRLVDLLSSTPRDAMTTGVQPGTDNHWYCLEGEWTKFQFAQVNVSSDRTNVDVQARDTHGHEFQDDFRTDDATQILVLEEDDAFMSMRIVAPLTDRTALERAAAAAAENAAEGESGLDGAEGETAQEPAFGLLPPEVPVATRSVTATDEKSEIELNSEVAIDHLMAEQAWPVSFRRR